MTLNIAIVCAEVAGVVVMTTALPTMAGYAIAHSTACCPPMQPPMTACRRSIPRRCTRRC
jgi:hypothetical protein